MAWRPLPTEKACQQRLQLIFPKTAFDTALSNPLAAWSVAAMIYVDAVVPASGNLPSDAVFARPTTALWMSPAAYARNDASSRLAWRTAALGGNAKRKVAALMADEWGVVFEPRYGTTAASSYATRHGQAGLHTEPSASSRASRPPVRRRAGPSPTTSRICSIPR